MGCCRIAELRHKEVIDRQSGCRLGYVDDVEIDTVSARLMSIIIYGRPRFFGLFGRCEDFVIRWDNIELIGEDTIIVKQSAAAAAAGSPRGHVRGGAHLRSLFL